MGMNMKNGILILGLMLSLFATESEARCRRGGCGQPRFPILARICGGRGQPSCGPSRGCGPGMRCGQSQGCGPGMRCGQSQGCGPGMRCGQSQGCGPGMRCGQSQGCGPGMRCGQNQGCGPGMRCNQGSHGGNIVGGNGAIGNQGRIVDPIVVDPSFVATNERPPASIDQDPLLPLLQDAGVPATVAKAIEGSGTPVASTERTLTINNKEEYYAALERDKGFGRIVVAFTANDCGSCPQFKKDLEARFASRPDVKIYFVNRDKIGIPDGNSLVTLYKQKGYLKSNTPDADAVPSGFVAFQQNQEWKINGGRVMEQFERLKDLENELVRQVGGQR